MGDEPLARRAEDSDVGVPPAGGGPLAGRADEPERASGSSTLRNVAAYAVARFLLAAGLTALIYGIFRLAGVNDFPIYIAAAFAIVIALPLGFWIFSPLRRRATASIAAFDERRRRDREQLQARLRGEIPPE